MLGELIGETKGKRIVRRVIATEPPTVEVTFEDSGTTHGIPCTGMGTYTSVIHPDGSITGEAHGITMTADGDTATWTATGIGKFVGGGAVSYRGMIFNRNATGKLAPFNNSCSAFEYESSATGETSAKMWEWK
jgi:hypothetical protein